MVKLEVTGTPAVGNGVSASFQGLRASTAALQVCRSLEGHNVPYAIVVPYMADTHAFHEIGNRRPVNADA